MKHTKPRFRMGTRLAAVKRRRKGVEFTAGLSSETNGFVLFRKRNPLDPRHQGRDVAATQRDAPGGGFSRPLARETDPAVLPEVES